MDWDEYLRPTLLCDFDRDRSIGERARREIAQARSEKEKAWKILMHLRDDIPYALDEWDVKASETLKKGYGMCMNKVNLAIAELRSLGVPARYKLVMIRRNEWFESMVTRGDADLVAMYQSVPPDIQHILCQVYVEGQWEEFDPARDANLEKSFQLLGIPQERIITAELSIFASPDEFVCQRQKHVLSDRQEFFRKVNEQIKRIRSHARSEKIAREERE